MMIDEWVEKGCMRDQGDSLEIIVFKHKKNSL